MSKYRFKNSSIYYSGTSIPKNRLNIQNAADIHEIENLLLEQAYKEFVSQLNSQSILDESYFIDLHKKTFESLYDFAGIYRDVNKRRQKLIDGVLQNTTEMYGSLQGIAGSGALAYIEALELPEEIVDEVDDD